MPSMTYCFKALALLKMHRFSAKKSEQKKKRMKKKKKRKLLVKLMCGFSDGNQTSGTEIGVHP